MTKKIRERAEMQWWGQFCAKYGCKFDMPTGMSAYDDLVDHFAPPVVRSDDATRASAFAKIREELDALEAGMPVDLSGAMRRGGLDVTSKSDIHATRQFLTESNLVDHKKSTPESWTRRISHSAKAGKENGETMSDDDIAV